MTDLCNRLSKEEALKRLYEEDFKRITLSFYRYIQIEDPQAFRDELFLKWSELAVFGRIYIAKEGINAQLSAPEHHFETFKEILEANPFLQNLRLNVAVEDDGKSFYKLTIKVKQKIVADGLNDDTFNPSDVGQHLSPEEWNQAMEDPNAILVDMRNHYESEVGRFEGAITPDADTFREELQIVKNLLKGKEDKKLLLYCTGGVRCEKASAYLKHEGFQNVNQLYGGIIWYAHAVKQKNLPSKFKGKNFVFDERLAEKITDDVLSVCHQCQTPCDTHTNCCNLDCHLLFIQCEACAKKYEGACTKKCQKIAALPEEEQKQLRRGKVKQGDCLSVYKSRLRPKLAELSCED